MRQEYCAKKQEFKREYGTGIRERICDKNKSKNIR